MEKVTTTQEVDGLLASNCPVSISISGGKDSCAVAFATVEYLDSIHHSGPRVLIHSDLGRVEWRDSLPTCERLARALNLELIVVRRQAGDMMDRWLTRWHNNLQRYINLECVKLILPWSTASMRFCTSELKTAVICRELINRFPGRTIISVNGIRREESANRAKAPVTKPQPKLVSRKHRTEGLDWHPILDWKVEDVFACLEGRRFAPHEAYRVYGSSRVSCTFCILGSRADLKASAGCEANRDVYLEMVRLEIESTFSFQDKQWLGDVASHLLSAEMRAGLARAKEAALVREAAEARIPKHLLYVKGWPTVLPSWEEAGLLCDVRQTVAATIGREVRYTQPAALIARYRELMEGAKKE